MKNIIWFDRKFVFDLAPEMFPLVVERLRGTPARLEEITGGLSPGVLTYRVGTSWTIMENAGHLLDLEPLWNGRVDDFFAGEKRLRAADLKNTKTHEASHNAASLAELLRSFRAEREKMVARFDAMDVREIVLTALHPRLDQPMRMIDLAFFVAEHDDHHLACITRLIRV
ncbi:MAG: DinB family protein [Candidatus Zixiibacteriota bacterium]|nr:MAG: DinB family protein [candidate division Zixibacteria bacterium]